MSPFDIIPIIIVIICLFCITIIVVRKFPELAIVDTTTDFREKEAEIKEKIIAGRFKRKLNDFWNKIILFLNPLCKLFLSIFNNLWQKVSEFERKHSIKKLEKENAELKIKALLLEAESLLKENKKKEAEQKYIEAISLDPRNIEIYRLLGDLYFDEKNYEDAKAAFEYILKLKPDDVDAHISLGLLLRETGDLQIALKHFQRATEILPNDPRNLDFLIETAIMLGNKILAEETWQKLKEINPENQKLPELFEKIKMMK